MLYKKHPDRIPRQLMTAPFISGMIIPLVFLDICLEIYHRISFPLYGIPLVKRGKYIKIDRHKLSYLHFWNKIFCAYCGYANGLIHYAQVIAGETETYWCGIKHQQDEEFVSPKHHEDFLEHGDKEAFHEFMQKDLKDMEKDDISNQKM